MLIASPCIGVCLLNKDHHYCEGCFRSRDEIAQWITLSDIQKKEVIQIATQRQIDLMSF